MTTRTPPKQDLLGEETTIIGALYVPLTRTRPTRLRNRSMGVAQWGIVVVLAVAVAWATQTGVAHVVKHHALIPEAPQADANPAALHPSTDRAVRAPAVVPAGAALAERPGTAVRGQGGEVVGERGRRAVEKANADRIDGPDPSAVEEPGEDAQVADRAFDEPAAGSVDYAGRVDEARMAPAFGFAHTGSEQERLTDRLREGHRLLKRRRLEDAEAAFRRVLTARPGHPAALSGLARVCVRRGEFDRARRFADLAVKAAPYHARYHTVLGDVLRSMGDSPAADAEYRLASRLKPGSPVDVAARSLPANPF